MGDVAFIVLRKREGLVQCIYEEGKSQFDIADLKERLGIEPNEKNILVRIILRSLERTLTSEECNTYRDIIYRHISTKEGYLSTNK